MKSHCDDMPELISLYLDDELDEVGRGRVRRHTAACAGCGMLYAQLQSVDEFFRAAPVRYAPRGFTDRTVKLAFDRALQEDVRLGLITLAVGAAMLAGLWFAGQIGLVWRIFTALAAPTAFMGADQWVPQLLEVVLLLARVGWSTLTSAGESLIVPLILYAVFAMGAFYALTQIMRRSGAAGRVV